MKTVLTNKVISSNTQVYNAGTRFRLHKYQEARQAQTYQYVLPICMFITETTATVYFHLL
jgi:hypothetical protein